MKLHILPMSPLFLLSLLVLSPALSLAQSFTDGYFNFPAPECFDEPEGTDFGVELVFETASDVPTYITPLVADIDNDGIHEIISMTANGYSSQNWMTNNWRAKDIVVFNGTDGSVELEFPTPLMHWMGPTPIAIGDLTGDGYGEIIIATLDHVLTPFADKARIMCYDYQGNLLWKSDTEYGINAPSGFGAPPAIADFNGDGNPEVYIFNEIYNGQTGALLAEGGNNGVGLMTEFLAQGSFGASVAVDLTDSPGLELAAGNTVYEVELNNLDGTAGNFMTPINANFTVENSPARDGFTAIADITLDGNLEVIVSTRRVGNPGRRNLYVWNPRNNSLIASATLANASSNPHQYRTGIAFIGDIDGDGTPNIGVCSPYRVEMFSFDGSQDLLLKWSLTTTDLSGLTKLTMFDFNQNGRKEIVYRDESTLRILDGSGNSAELLVSIPCFSHTGAEGPIVADVTGNGSAEILVTSNNNNSDNPPHIGRIQVYQSSSEPWSPARSVWNQYQYFNVNIKDDLSIPTEMPNHGFNFFDDESFCPITFERRPLNNFLVQSTYYDEYGCRVTPLADASIEIAEWLFDCGEENQLELIYHIINQSNDAPLPPNLQISFYEGNPQDGGSLIGTVILNESIPAGGQLNDLVAELVWTGNLQDLYAVVNDDGQGPLPLTFPITTIEECNYSNNIDFIEIGDLPTSLETSEIILTCDTNEVGMVADTFTNALDCDSIHTVIFELVPSHDIYEENWVCQPADSGLIVFEGENQFGCDSVHQIWNRLAPSHKIFLEDASCEPSDSGLLVLDLVNQYGCDSTVYIETELLPSNQSSDLLESCHRADTGLTSVTYQNQYGCDSVHTVVTELLPSDTLIFEEASCDPGEAGLMAEEYTNQHGCDSFHLIQTELLPSDSTFEFQSSVFPEDTGRVVMSFTNQHGCDSIHTVITEIEPRIYIPNAFSPNDDGINDVFRVFANDLRDLEYSIYNRWGSRVFETHHINRGWDGTFNGRNASEGVYVIEGVIYFSKGRSQRFSGEVMLVR